MSVKVSSKYQVVIPEQVREALGITPGQEMDVIAKGGIAYLVPVKPLRELASTLRGRLSTADIGKVRDKKDRKI